MQMAMKFETIDDIFLEFVNKDHQQIITTQLRKDLMQGDLKYNISKAELTNWYCKKFFDIDLEISCDDLFEIAADNGVKLRG